MMSDYFEITSGTCETCGTDVLCDEESGAEVHLDPSYAKCGTEGWCGNLVDTLGRERVDRCARAATPRLRVVS